MMCPKCFGEMTQVSEQSTAVHRCDTCHGLHFERLTQQNLDQIAGEVHLDTGDEELGAEYDEMVYVECPKCDQIMDQRLTEDPVRIRFELCIACHAAFLDAGEFRLYLSDEYANEFRTLLPE